MERLSPTIVQWHSNSSTTDWIWQASSWIAPATPGKCESKCLKGQVNQQSANYNWQACICRAKRAGLFWSLLLAKSSKMTGRLATICVRPTSARYKLVWWKATFRQLPVLQDVMKPADVSESFSCFSAVPHFNSIYRCSIAAYLIHL